MQYFFSGIRPVEKQEKKYIEEKYTGAVGKPLLRLFFSLNQIIIRDMKNLCKCFQFQICDIVFVSLNPGNYIFIHIVACQLELAGKITLGETVLASQCNQAFTDQVFFA